MKFLAFIVFSLTAGLALSGCINTNALQAEEREDMQRVSAVAIRENIAPDQVTISNVRDASFCTSYCNATWHASAPSGEYDCTAVWGPTQPLGMHKTVCIKK
jgi:hypothetical protein